KGKSALNRVVPRGEPVRDAAGEFEEAHQGRAGQGADLGVPRGGRLDEVAQLREATERVLVSWAGLFQFRDAVAQQGERRVDFAALALVGDDLEHLPDVGQR